MSQERKSVQYLPSWRVRQSIWLEKLSLELEDKGYLVNRSEDSFSEGLESLYKDADAEAPDMETFSNWFKLKIYPKGTNLDNLCKVSILSRKWLKTDAWEQSLSDSMHESLHTLCNAIDYFICSVQPNIKPTLFKKDEQYSFSTRCLARIAGYWNISSIYDDEGHSLRRKIQDVSLSKLKTHGYSAIPFYLCSVVADEDVSDSENFDWYIDLLSSTLIVYANLYRKNIEFDKSYPEPYSDIPEYFGTCPNLLGTIAKFLFQSREEAINWFKDERIHCSFDEIKDGETLLKWIVSGDALLKKELEKLGSNYDEIKSIFHTNNILAKFLPEVLKLKINNSEYQSFKETVNKESYDSFVFYLTPKTSNSVTKVEKVVNGGEIRLVSCQFPNDLGPEEISWKYATNGINTPDQYSWGYGGDGVRNLAYTLLFELFNSKNSRVERNIPKPFQMQRLVYNLLSRLYTCFSYSITSEQILDAIKEPIIYRERKSPKIFITLEDFVFIDKVSFSDEDSR